jgi:secreted PhoX family phosphatase
VRLVRNHERGYSPVPFEGSGDEPLVGDPARAYDRNAGGACTNMLFDTRSLRLLDSRIAINGTSVNCAGGPTPQGTWLTCEETIVGTQSVFPEDGTADPTLVYEQDHGYVFEVPAEGVVSDPQPLKAMGRFVHEAVAVDPRTGVVYETEDANPSGFYRFLPAVPGDLAAGGRLQMLAVRRSPGYDTRTGQRVGRPLPVEWVDVPDPDPAYPADFDGALGSLVYRQGFARGGATFARLEGCWWGERSVYLNSTSGGNAGVGQVWQYRPLGPARGILTLIFESPSPELLDSPDNITVSPRGGVVLCEDGDDEQYLRGLDHAGRIFDFGLNLISGDEDKEFAGATYSPDGATLFVNIQTPGVSFAIRGPWDRGDL